MKKRITILSILALTAVLLAGCSAKNVQPAAEKQPAPTEEPAQIQQPEETAKVNQVINMTMAEARELFASEGEYLIVDVRTPAEFADGHIPGAINIPNEEIGIHPPELLPDKDAAVYLYCRSGNRSGQAAYKLQAMGYSNVINFGGIIDWTGDIEK